MSIAGASDNQAAKENRHQDDGFESSNWNEIYESFDDIKLKDELLRGIHANGFEKPSHTQQRGVIPIIRGNDTIGQAQSGTSKRAAFGVSSFQPVERRNPDYQVHLLQQSATRVYSSEVLSCVLGIIYTALHYLTENLILDFVFAFFFFSAQVYMWKKFIMRFHREFL
jgi:superfamily II DNA/RNA helicase